MKKFEDKDKLNEFFAKFIKEIRIEKHLTQAKLAEMLDIDTQHMSKIENLKKNVTLDLFLEFCKQCDINPITAFTIVYKSYEHSTILQTTNEDHYIIAQINKLSVTKKIIILELINKLNEL